jgi:hypothetical protein
MPLSVEVVENFTRMELGKDMKPSLLKTWLENTLKKCRHNKNSLFSTGEL